MSCFCTVYHGDMSLGFCFLYPGCSWIMLCAQQSKRKGLRTQLKSFFLLLLISTSSDIDAPTNLVTTEVTEDTATVSWDRVQAEIEGYILSYTTAEGSSVEIPVGRDSTSYRLVGLRPGVLHTVYIWAYKGEKVSRKSSTEAETGKL